MNTTKKLGRVTSSGLFKLSLLLLALLLPIIMVFGQASSIKKTLAGSGIYNTAVDSALDSAQKESNKNNNGQSPDPNQNPSQTATSSSEDDGGLPLDDPQVRAVINEAVPGSQIQRWAEQLIDSGYNWLNGTTAEPVINLDFTQTKQKLADGLGNYAVTRAKGLPVCTVAELQALQAQGGDVDPFKITCLPPGYNVEELRAQVQQEVLNNSDILEKNSFTTADIPKDKDNGKTAFQQLEPARTAYKWAKVTPYIWAGLAIIFAALLIILHDNRRRGAFVVGRTFAIVGGIVTFLAVLSRLATNQITSNTGPLANQVQGNFQDTILYIARNLSNSLNNIYLIIGLVYLLIGVGMLVALRLTRPKNAGTAQEASAEQPAVAESSNTPEASTATNESTETSGDASKETPEVAAPVPDENVAGAPPVETKEDETE